MSFELTPAQCPPGTTLLLWIGAGGAGPGAGPPAGHGAAAFDWS